MAHVTVVVPTFRRPDYLRAALDSALGQTYPHFTVLVLDNDVEGTANGDVIASIGDPRIRHVRNTENLGPYRNWLVGVARAQTEVVASLHDDDVWEPEFLEVVALPLVEDPSTVASFCEVTLIDSEGNQLMLTTAERRLLTRLDSHPEGSRERSRLELVRGGLIDGAFQVAYAGAFRRSLVSEHDYPAFADPFYDLWFNYLLARSGARVHVTHRPMTRYRIHSDQDSVVGRHDDRILACYRHFLDDPELAVGHPLLRERLARFHYDWGARQLRDGDARGAAEQFAVASDGLTGARKRVARLLAHPVPLRAVAGPTAGILRLVRPRSRLPVLR